MNNLRSMAKIIIIDRIIYQFYQNNKVIHLRLMLQKGSRHSKIMQIFDLQNDFLKHRQKIIKTQRRDVSHNIKKSYNSQMQMINSFRKNWLHAQNFKYVQKQKQICHNNKLLHQSLYKQYNRQISKTGPGTRNQLNRTSSSNSISRISLVTPLSKSRKDMKISEQNERLMKKILSIQSSLAHGKLKSQYKKVRANRQKLEVYSSKNKERLRNSLRKMNIEPVVSFPKMRQKYSTLVR